MNQINKWYNCNSPTIYTKESKSLLHNFVVNGIHGITINPYQGCHHRCAYCYATYDWSPDFYDKVYSKINASNLLIKELLNFKSEYIKPVMISSATDAYQPAELKYKITRDCIKILQKYNLPYYIFTKSTNIKRDIKLHEKYKNNCFIVWSITTNNEFIRRIIEPGTPSSKSLFDVIKNFHNSGIKCVINIDPLLPLITDTKQNIQDIFDNLSDVDSIYIHSSFLRLRRDIWERIKIILNLLNIKYGLNVYRRLYGFNDPITQELNLYINSKYSFKIHNYIKSLSIEQKFQYGFPKIQAVKNKINRKFIRQKYTENLMNFI
ncbi:MAG: SPL family radical SAM protein [Nitrososphaeraceae archaeon]